MNDTEIEDALHAWVVTASGYTGSAVIWDVQGGARPTTDFITLRLGGLGVIGNGDNISQDVDLARPNGEEVEIIVEGPREVSVLVQAFTHAVIGSASGRSVLGRIQAALNLPSVIESFHAVKLASIDPGTVQNGPTLLGATRFEGRAMLDVRFNTTSAVSEFTGYINAVAGAGEVAGFNAPGDIDFAISAT